MIVEWNIKSGRADGMVGEEKGGGWKVETQRVAKRWVGMLLQLLGSCDIKSYQNVQCLQRFEVIQYKSRFRVNDDVTAIGGDLGTSVLPWRCHSAEVLRDVASWKKLLSREENAKKREVDKMKGQRATGDWFARSERKSREFVLCPLVVDISKI